MSLLDEIDGNTWIVSDTHFRHGDRVEKFHPIREQLRKEQGFGNHDHWLIHNWNSVVGYDDLLLHLGDLAFLTKSEYKSNSCTQAFNRVLDRLNGRMVLVLGNHDYRYKDYYLERQKRFPERFMVVEGVPGFLDDNDVSGLILELTGKRVFFSHYTLVTEDEFTRGYSKEARDIMAKLYRKESCDLCVHGHLHTNDEGTNKRLEKNVSIERTGLKPIKISSLFSGK